MDAHIQGADARVLRVVQRVLLCSEREELLSVVGHALHGAGTHVVPPALQEDLPDDALSLPPQAEETTDKQPSSGGAARGASDAAVSSQVAVWVFSATS